MSRRLNTFPDPEPAVVAAWSERAGPATETGWTSYRCTLVTPLYGGGVTAGQVDREMPIRSASLRGQLRFWWRIACGPVQDSQAMFKRECAIWGGIGDKGPTASRVKIRVIAAPASDQQLIASDSEHDPGVRYAFGPATINGDTQWLKPGYPFKLSVFSSDDISAEVGLALRWWASFGGLGARTRRGFGAVRVSDLDPVTEDMVRGRDGVLAFARGGSGNAEAEWRRAITKLFAFRQGPGVGRRANRPRPGRSYWPEPDQIRRFFPGRDANGQHIPRHEAGNLFPRAAFGLPIRFEFPGSPRNGEPPTTELVPAEGEDRMASPLIVRPYWNGQRWLGAALLLPSWPQALVTPLRFRSHGFLPGRWPDSDADRHAAASTIEPMKRQGVPVANDPLSAFMHFFAEA